jgi:hypothetical protein
VSARAFLSGDYLAGYMPRLYALMTELLDLVEEEG